MLALFDEIKKRRLHSAVSALLLALPLVVYVLALNRTVGVYKTEEAAPVLVIDAGHGGIDCGAVAADGSKESDINLAIALKLRALAELYGQDNSLIRQEDITLSDGDEYSEHRDLERRAEIVNNEAGCVYLSIHQNFYPSGQPNGSLVIYSDDEESEAFGKLTHANLINSLNPENRRVAEPADDKYYILSHVDCPAILVECGFMSNFSEMEKLKSPNYQTAVAAVLMASFLQYTNKSGYI